MIKKLLNMLSGKEEEIIFTDKTNEIMNSLKSHDGKDIKHITKVKIIENVRQLNYEIIKKDEAELKARLQEVVDARILFEQTNIEQQETDEQ